MAAYLAEKRLVTPAQLAAANSIEFGVPVFDVGALDPNQSAIKLVSEELVRKHNVLPLFKRGNRLFVGIADPTNTQALDEIKFQTNLVVEPILVDEDRIHRTIDQWLAAADALDDAHGRRRGAGEPRRQCRRRRTRRRHRRRRQGRRHAGREVHQQGAGRRDPPRRLGHPLRALRNRIPRAPAHRRPAQAGRQGAGEAAGAHRRAPEGDGAAGHRREARAAGRPHQAQPQQDQADRLPRQHAADAVRREGGAAYPRRQRRQARHRQAGLRGRPEEAVRRAPCSSPTAWCWSPARPARARRCRCTPR